MYMILIHANNYGKLFHIVSCRDIIIHFSHVFNASTFISLFFFCECSHNFSVPFALLAELCSILNFLKIIFIFLVVNQCSFILLIHPIVDQPLHAEFNREMQFGEFFFKFEDFLVKIWKFSSFSKKKNSTFWTFYLL